jgi:hypothetical protein
MIDYGIIALVLIQLAAVAGCLMAWLRIRAEIDRIKDRAVTEPAMNTALENRISPVLVRLVDVEAGLVQCEQATARSATDSARAIKAAGQTEELERKIISVQNSLSAFKRHRAAPAEEETISNPETITDILPQIPPPSHNGRSMSTFGRTA